MAQTIRATFDGKVFVPEEPVDLAPDARVTLAIGPRDEEGNEPCNFLKVVQSLNLKGPTDTCERLDDYLYGEPSSQHERGLPE